MMLIALPCPLTPSKTKYWKLKEWTRINKEGKLKEHTQKWKEWNQKVKEWTMMPYLLSENDIVYGIIPPSTTKMKEPIEATWDVAT